MSLLHVCIAFSLQYFVFLFIAITKLCFPLFAKSHRCDDIALIFPLNFLRIESICMDSTNGSSIESMSIRLENAKCLYLVNWQNAFWMQEYLICVCVCVCVRVWQRKTQNRIVKLTVKCIFGVNWFVNGLRTMPFLIVHTWWHFHVTFFYPIYIIQAHNNGFSTIVLAKM